MLDHSIRYVLVYGVVFYAVPVAAVIVGKRFPFPRWFLNGASPPPPGNDFVVVGTDFVLDGADFVIVPA